MSKLRSTFYADDSSFYTCKKFQYLILTFKTRILWKDIFIDDISFTCKTASFNHIYDLSNGLPKFKGNDAVG